MSLMVPYSTVDFITIGHITKDITPGGAQLGGTVSYSALTAHALGLRAGIVTAWAEDIGGNAFPDIQIVNSSREVTTTFENIETSDGRIQYLFDTAKSLNYKDVPEIWRSASIVHFGPVANEVDPEMVYKFKSSFIGMTPQGWFRLADSTGRVRVNPRQNDSVKYQNCGAVVISEEDLENDEPFLEDLVNTCPVVAVTEGERGVRLYWNGDVRRFNPPNVRTVDTTGAGDIFAASFFIRLYTTRDPWASARFATNLASFSTTRVGLASIPTQIEIKNSIVEVM